MGAPIAGGVAMRMGGVPFRSGGDCPTCVRDEVLPVWCVLMVKALCLGSKS